MVHIISAIVKGSGLENGENRSNILRVKKKTSENNVERGLHSQHSFNKCCVTTGNGVSLGR